MQQQTPGFPQQIPKALLDTSESVLCSQCGHDVFVPAMEIKKIPAVVSRSGSQELAILQVFICSECGTRAKNEENKESSNDVPRADT